MARDMREALRDGSVSLHVAKFSNKTLRETRDGVPTKMADFDDQSKPDEYIPRRGVLKKHQIDDPKQQKVGRGDESGMPTRDRGARKSPFGKSRGSVFSEGSGGVVGRYAPGPKHIDQYPDAPKNRDPSGAKFAGPPAKATGNTKMKGKKPAESGAQQGANARHPHYYGGPNNRNREDQ